MTDHATPTYVPAHLNTRARDAQWTVAYLDRDDFDTDTRSHDIRTQGKGHRDQFESTKAVVQQVIESGAVGPKDGDYSIHLFGHYVPGHEPQEGMPMSGVTITIHYKGADATKAMHTKRARRLGLAQEPTPRPKKRAKKSR